MLHEVQSFAKELSLNISIDNIFVNGEPDGNYDAIHRYKFYHEQAQRVFYRILKVYHCAEVYTPITRWAFCCG